MGRYMTASGKKASSSLDDAITLMAKSMKVNGSMENLKDQELNHGLMAASMTASGT